MQNKNVVSMLNMLKEISKKEKKKILKFYTPELMLRKNATGAEYEITEVDFEDEENPLVNLYRYNPDGSRAKTDTYTGDEIIKDFEIA